VPILAAAAVSPAAARARFRAGLKTPTAGWSSGFAQANLIAVPTDLAGDFKLFAERNPASCPLLDVTETTTTALADGADLRTDLPAYRIWQRGDCVAEVLDATPYWRDDLVTFLIGCSFTFEGALAAAGIALRHIDENVNIPMFRTNRTCETAGVFAGPLVVSMRPIPAHLVPLAIDVTRRYPAVHGAPLHVGDPAALGIKDLRRPDFGDPVTIGADEVPVFWACGVTPQAAVMATRPPFAISHSPGHMLITDVPDTTYRVNA
jgi:uncharacterized protein YcsI (UPF0317 family)